MPFKVFSAEEQLFALPAHAVVDPDDHAEFWFAASPDVWDVRQGRFTVEDDGRLVFMADNSSVAGEEGLLPLGLQRPL